MKAVNRRGFLKGTGMVAGGLLVESISGRAALGQTKEPIKIGFPVPLTGPYGPEAADQVAGATLAFEEFNARGGVLGRKVELIVRDDQLKPGIGAQRAKELIENEKVHFMSGVLAAHIQMAVNEQTKNAKMIYFSISQSNEITAVPDWSPWTFHEAINPHITSQAVGSWAVDKLGKRVFVLYADYAFGRQLLEGFKKIVEAKGGALVGAIPHPLGATDYSGFFPRIRDAKPDVLVLANFGKDQLNSVKQAHSFGLKKEMKLVCPVLLMTTRREAGAEVFEEVYGGTSFYWELAERIPSAKRFVEAFQKRWNRPPIDYAGYAYSAIRILLESVERVGTTDSDKVAKGLEGLVYDTYKGKQWIRKCDHQSFQDVYILRSRGPRDQKGDWGVFEIVATIPASEALERSCKALGHEA